MNSETSTESVGLAPSPDASADHRRVGAAGQPDDALRPWQLFTLAGLIGATVVVFVSTGQTPAGIILLSLTIFTAAVVGVAAWRTLSPLIGSDEVLGSQLLAGRTRAALEREKTLVLRSIKDLEFDRAMGKVSDKDFAEMSARLRSRAAGLIRQLDAGHTYREQIEQEIARRVGQHPEKTSGGSSPRGGPQESAARAIRICSECRRENDPDARFCKNCGARLGTVS
jgi:zinc-ribbon domain